MNERSTSYISICKQIDLILIYTVGCVFTFLTFRVPELFVYLNGTRDIFFVKYIY